jgi:hypothetical protein
MSAPLPKIDVILVGCVKSKCSYIAPAKDLYNSTLWRWRRAYAEMSGCQWYILSAKHGLLHPDVEIAPYDLALVDLPVFKRREWSQHVLSDLTRKFHNLQGKVIEVHAGKEYVKYGLEDGLCKSGAFLYRPLAHIGLFRQPAWYREQLNLSSSQE